MRAKSLSLLLLCLALTVPAAWAAKPPSISVAVTPQTSDPGGVIPNIGGMGNAAVSTYAYQITAGDSITDSLPIQLCVTSTPNAVGATGYPLTIHFAPEGLGGNLPGVSFPADMTFAADGCQIATVGINTGALAEGAYNQNLVTQVRAATPANTQVGFDHPVIHIKTKVNAASVLCFTSDSDFNFLVDCSGNPITSGSAGTFSLVTNKQNIEVATNPGQFYYNILYTNTTGADQTVSVSFVRNGVVPHGTQAIHALAFPSFPVLSSGDFEAVNNAIPGGADDQIAGISVPAGWTLWVDYHLEWAGIGAPAPAGIATSCSTANQNFSVLGNVTLDSDNSLLGTCGAGASGYKK